MYEIKVSTEADKVIRKWSKTSAEMTNQSFVSDFLNPGIGTWRLTHTGYDDYKYIYHPANYTTIQKY